jgi:hypothetical protein
MSHEQGTNTPTPKRRRACARSRAIAMTILAMAGTAPLSVEADVWIPRAQEFTGMQGDHLGTTIAVRTVLGDNNTRIVTRVYVGSPYKDLGAMADVGEVDLYDPAPNGWTYVGSLFSNAPQAGAHFGASLAVDDGTVLVGSPDYNVSGIGAGAGRIEFWVDSGPPNLFFRGARNGSGGNFGSDVAIDGIMAVASVPNAGGGSGCIATYRYNSSNTTWENFPAATSLRCGSSGAALGASLAIKQTTADTFLLIAGAPGESQGANLLAGAAHVYIPSTTTTTNGGLIEIGTLAAQSPTAFDVFGTSVGIDANFAYVGATGRDNGVGRVGSVTIFKQALVIGYNYLYEYFPSPPATIGGLCGASLSVDEVYGQFVMGCPNSTGSVAHEGTARVYRQFDFLGQPVWLDSVLSFGSQLHGGDALGTSVALSGDHAFAGAPNVNFPSPQTNNGGWKEFVPDRIFRDGFE